MQVQGLVSLYIIDLWEWNFIDAGIHPFSLSFVFPLFYTLFIS
jgi:hypothetical protein